MQLVGNADVTKTTGLMKWPELMHKSQEGARSTEICIKIDLPASYQVTAHVHPHCGHAMTHFTMKMQLRRNAVPGEQLGTQLKELCELNQKINTKAHAHTKQANRLFFFFDKPEGLVLVDSHAAPVYSLTPLVLQPAPSQDLHLSLFYVLHLQSERVSQVLFLSLCDTLKLLLFISLNIIIWRYNSLLIVICLYGAEMEHNVLFVFVFNHGGEYAMFQQPSL